MMPQNPLVGGSVLRIPAIQSPNYVAGTSGWALFADGSAEFNDVTIRGSLVATTQLNYSGTPAAGNLVQSSGFTTAGTDGFGNNYVAGSATYASGFAVALTGGIVQFYTGSLSGGWTSQGTLETDSDGDLQFTARASGAGIELATGTNGLVELTTATSGLETPLINVNDVLLQIPQPAPADTAAAIISTLQTMGLFS